MDHKVFQKLIIVHSWFTELSAALKGLSDLLSIYYSHLPERDESWQTCFLTYSTVWPNRVEVLYGTSLSHM